MSNSNVLYVFELSGKLNRMKEDSTSQRLKILAGHVAEVPGPTVLRATPQPLLPSCHASKVRDISPANCSSSSGPYASVIQGQPSSYARVHGDVAHTPVQWRIVPSVQKEFLQEVKYEKSIGEGIAKVRRMNEVLGALWGKFLKPFSHNLADNHKSTTQEKCVYTADGEGNVSMLL